MPAIVSSALTRGVFERLADPRALLELFEHLPRVYLFIKDRQSRFVRVNRSMLLLHGCTEESQMLGRTDFDFHPPALAAQYVEEDVVVMTSRQPLCDQVWLVMGHDRVPRWYLSTKLPLLDAGGETVGLAGVLRPYDQTGPCPAHYSRLTPAMEYVIARYGQPVELAHLAALTHLSVSQFQREFQRLFGMTPGEYLLKVRLLMARRALEESDAPAGTIALDCGFYDQSHFNRAFRAHLGLAPLSYRKRFRR
jgi:AraC-like DNA-binding protein